eukprot:TRINITY_DN10067_c0_g3_i1.p1 TRINITY_DN10067_c0_g3~~TRINITY_DN10067_c0_g3_i1.p1  ORF type:complete len:108 (-),score=2.75 TRINITY_DN10067_c0_g3_i1:32-355(-)
MFEHRPGVPRAQAISFAKVGSYSSVFFASFLQQKLCAIQHSAYTDSCHILDVSILHFLSLNSIIIFLSLIRCLFAFFPVRIRQASAADTTTIGTTSNGSSKLTPMLS